MFDLADAYYVEGAPVEWRRWLTPGTDVVLRFAESGLTIYAEKGSAKLAWSDVARLSVRGPDRPEHVKAPGGNLLAGLLGALIVNAGSEFRRCWLAVVSTDGNELIFEVKNLLRADLERVLEEHSE